MNWTLEEAITYYKTQGTPADQSTLINLLREVQKESGGSIPLAAVGQISTSYSIKETYLLAIIKRFPSLRLGNTHCLELCAGPNCRKHASLAAYAEKVYMDSGKSFILKYTPCMRMCGKGPNIKLDGKLYHNADLHLIQQLLSEAGMDF